MGIQQKVTKRGPDTEVAVADAVTATGDEKRDAVERVEVLAGEYALAGAYGFLQKVIGIVAFVLPFVVALGDWALDGHALRGSISAYYYGRTGNYFVGSLCALGVFFLSYQHRPLRGHRSDNRMGIAACFLAIGVALLPTSSDGSKATDGSKNVGHLHLFCAGALFCLLGLFSLYQFTKTEGEITAHRTYKQKLLR